MNGLPSLSIAMATYNGATFLPAQLQSLAKQSIQPLELVVCDDRSTDGTLEIIRCFAETAPFLVSITANNAQLGYKRNFMAAAQRCSGDIIAFCDQDDVWHPEKIAVVSRCMSDLEVDFCFHDYDLIDVQEQITTRGYSQAKLSEPGSIGTALGLTQAFRRSLLELSESFNLSRDENHPDEVMAHDQWMHFSARCRGAIKHIPRALLGYRQHGNNVCGQAYHNEDVERQLSRNFAIIKSRLQGDLLVFEQKRQLLQADLDWQHFSLSHRIGLIEHLMPVIRDTKRALELKSAYRSRLGHVEDRLQFYRRLSWSGRMSTFAHLILTDAKQGLLRTHLKARLLDLAYGPGATSRKANNFHS